MELLLWEMTGDDEYDQDGLEHNGSQDENNLFNVIVINKSDWYWEELNWLQHECFAITRDGILLPSSTRTIEDIYKAFGVLEIVHCVHGAAVEGMADSPRDVIAKWSVESVSVLVVGYNQIKVSS